MVTVVKMKATSTTLTAGHPTPTKQRKRKKVSTVTGGGGGGGGGGRWSLPTSEKETGFRLSQEFPNSNWLERKIQLEIQQAKKQDKR